MTPLQGLGVLLQVWPFDEHGHPHRGQFGLLAAAQYRETFVRQAAAKKWRDDCHIDETSFERLRQDRDVADDDHLNIVAPLVHAEMFEPHRRGLPNAAANALYAESLAGEIFGAFDVGAGDQIEAFPAAQTGDDLHVAAADCRR